MVDEGGPERVARAYIAAVAARDAGLLAAVFAEKGHLYLPVGIHLAGRAGITQSYRILFNRNPSPPKIVTVISEGQRSLTRGVLRGWE